MSEGIESGDPLRHFIDQLEMLNDDESTQKPFLSVERIHRAEKAMKAIGKVGGHVLNWGAKATAAVLLLTLSAQSVLQKNPDIVSSPVEDYMQENDIPLALIDGLDVEGLRVYDENNLSAAFHASFLGYEDAASNVFNERAVFMRGDEYSMIVMSPKRTAAEEVSYFAGIPVDDVQVDEKMGDLFHYWTLMHEVGHFSDNVSKSARNSDPKRVRVLLNDERTLSGEIFADKFALDRVGELNPDLEQHVLYLRALNGVLGQSASHSSAVFLEAMFSEDEIQIPTLEGVEHKYDLLREELIFSYAHLYMRNDLDMPDDEPSSYVYYLGALDLKDRPDIVEDLPLSIQRALDIYMEALEFYAPEKTIQLQSLYQDLKEPNANAPDAGIVPN